MKFFNHILYLEFSDLTQYGVSENTLKSGLLRNRKEGNPAWSHIPDPADNRKVLIDYDSIPSFTLINYSIPTKNQLVKEITLRNIRDLVKIDLSDKDFFLNNPASHNLAHEYSRIASWLKFSASQKNRSAKEFGFEGLDELYDMVIKLMLEEKFKTWSVSNLRVFKRRLQPFNQLYKNKISNEAALETLICRKFGKENAAKLGPEQKALLVQLYSDPRKANFEQVYTMYLNVCSEKISEHQQTKGESGWSEKCLVSIQTIKNYLHSEDVIQLWYHKRHGAGEWRQKFDPTIKRNPPSFANALWVMDGSPWHMYYREGKNAYARLNIFPIIDAYSWCVIGFSVDYNETADQVHRALLGACKRSGVIPYQLQYDHSSANMSFKVQEAVDKLVKYDTPTQVGNARAKIIEPFFRHFNDQVLKFYPNYAGSNITSKKLDSKINREEIMALIKTDQIPSKEGAINQVIEAFKLWNKKAFNGDKSPLQNYIESFEKTKDKQRYFTPMMLVDAFWEMPGKRIKVKNEKGESLQKFEPTLYTFSNAGIRVERKDPVTDQIKRFDFDVEDAQFRARNINRKFSIKYDPEEMDMAYLYDGDRPVTNEQGNLVVALEKTILSMAIVDRKNWEAKAFHRLNNLRKEQFQLIQKNHEEMIQITKLNGTFTPVTHNNLYPKEMMNAIAASNMEALIESVEVILPRTKKELKKAKTNMARFSDDTPEIPEIKSDDVQPQIPKRWQ